MFNKDRIVQNMISVRKKIPARYKKLRSTILKTQKQVRSAIVRAGTTSAHKAELTSFMEALQDIRDRAAAVESQLVEELAGLRASVATVVDAPELVITAQPSTKRASKWPDNVEQTSEVFYTMFSTLAASRAKPCRYATV